MARVVALAHPVRGVGEAAHRARDAARDDEASDNENREASQREREERGADLAEWTETLAQRALQHRGDRRVGNRVERRDARLVDLALQLELGGLARDRRSERIEECR